MNEGYADFIEPIEICRRSNALDRQKHSIKRQGRELEAELSQYKRIVAEQTFELKVLKDIVEKKL